MYKSIVFECLRKVINEHGYLGNVCNRDIHEQALAHRLAFHLENSGFFSGYSIDCEYNRHRNEPKGFRPDILIHVRGNDDANLIIIETKKFNDPLQEINEAKNTLGDRKRILRYYNAFLVVFPERLGALGSDSVQDV